MQRAGTQCVVVTLSLSHLVRYISLAARVCSSPAPGEVGRGCFPPTQTMDSHPPIWGMYRRAGAAMLGDNGLVEWFGVMGC